MRGPVPVVLPAGDDAGDARGSERDHDQQCERPDDDFQECAHAKMIISALLLFIIHDWEQLAAAGKGRLLNEAA